MLPGRVLPIAACAAIGLVWVAGQPMLHALGHVQEPVAFGGVCPTSAFAASGLTLVCVYSIAACAASGRDCSTTACAASGRVSLLWQPVLLLKVSIVQQSVLSLDVSVCLFYSSLCFLWTCLCVCSTAVCAFSGRVCVSVLQQSVLSPEMSGLQLHACASKCTYLCICSTAANDVPRGEWPTAACAASVLSVCKSLCCTWTCKSFVLHLGLPTRALCCT